MQNFLAAETKEVRGTLLKDFLNVSPSPDYFYDLGKELWNRGRIDLISEVAEGLPEQLRKDISTDFATVPELAELARLFQLTPS